MPPPPRASKQKQLGENKLQEGSKKPLLWVPMEGLRDNDIGIFKGSRLGKATQERDEVDLEAAEEAKRLKAPPPPPPPLRLNVASGCPSGNR